MNREEAINKIDELWDIEVLSDSNANDVIDEIYDDLESRTCENCKYKMKVENPRGYCKLISNNIPFKDYGCNKWVVKDG